MKIRIDKQELISFNSIIEYPFPKYTSQLINWANQNAQGTRPRVVGQLSDLFPQFENEVEDITIQAWKDWYCEEKPDAIDIATIKISDQMEKLKDAIQLINKDMIREWVFDLVINKTYLGLYAQEAILMKISLLKNLNYRLATKEEESRGIDGYVGDIPYQIKPTSYKTMDRLPEMIDCKIVYYEKNKQGIDIEFED